MYAGTTANKLALNHDEQRQVQVALNARAMAVHLQAAFGVQSPGNRLNSSDCHLLYVKYDPGQYCYTLYRLGTQMVTGMLQWPEPRGDILAEARLIPDIGMHVFPFEHDPALPGLRVAADGWAMAGVLAETLAECQTGRCRVLRCCVTPVRYRPGLRCTLRLNVWLRDTQSHVFVRRTLFAKIYNNLSEMISAHRAMEVLSNSASAQQRRVVVARAIALVPELRVILQESVEGTPLELYLSGMERDVTTGDPRGWMGVVRSAEALAAVHATELSVDRQRPIAEELEHFVQRASRAATVSPVDGVSLIELVKSLITWYDKLAGWGAQMRLTHGDCKPSQMLVDGKAIAILDFDNCGMADPASDVGTYLATLRQLGVWQSLRANGSAAAQVRKAWLRALEDRFLEEYCKVAKEGADFRQRAIWYEAVGLTRKAIRAFARSPRSLMPSAQVEEAWRCLETLPAAGSGQTLS